MLNFNIKLDSKIEINEHTADDILVLFGHIGGLAIFIYLVLTPLMSLLVGNRYYFSLLSSLYWVNETKDKTG